MDSEKTNRKRKPLSDITNKIPSSNLRSQISKPKPHKNRPPSAKKSEQQKEQQNSSSKDRTYRPKSQTVQSPTPDPPPSSTPQPKPSQIFDSIDNEGSQIRTTYNRRKNKGKEVVEMVSTSCPPVGRTTTFRDKLKDACVAAGVSKPCSVSCVKGKKKQRLSVPESVDRHYLPQDFIDKQRAHFAEIDAFELPEEVVSESELE